ncbi:MAG: hypothetical protein A2W65_02795 [Candidatus Taylorbacteria bacterium RIFCSPLOWO2_02_50_13]|nr:MAG: hypothetical protein A3B27_01435 [Candidatus Taylorbacteria bacterium RIFCSPLOWO2_01_FULL_50_130]OHA37397.1 MAG: hypothetical protein A2W65_02795 [Candidatus Taylorbacteria bacterium RIFCSPLOWO2_02_50_13]OHA45855.1 MAG: hypothetical protein A3G61_03600 [Candidatus Taylorbacteria bacterium RIFCSPLOWO2_12_FULL_49_67]
MSNTVLQSNKQNAHLTFKANRGIGRHDWLRLTPAYSVHLVKQELEQHDPAQVVLDPFSGTGTTGICAAENGHDAILTDLNPFLIWLAKAKSYNYSTVETSNARAKLAEVLSIAEKLDANKLWIPPLHNIERWWGSAQLKALAQLRAAIYSLAGGKENDLLLIGFCNTLIKVSNAAFNHQSVSFKKAPQAALLDIGDGKEVFVSFFRDVEKIIESAEIPLDGAVSVVEVDARKILTPQKADIVITSPPYVNRMSYIRELRPYMYWLGFLEEAKEAGELDWKAIGGTWGTATSKLNSWADARAIPIKDIEPLTQKIAAANDKNGNLLSVYVKKYFYDMWEHFESVHKVLNPGAQLVYIVGNSSFYGHVVPAEQWYGELMSAIGFENVMIETIRKRNSNKALFEFAVRAEKA